MSSKTVLNSNDIISENNDISKSFFSKGFHEEPPFSGKAENALPKS